MSEVVFMRCKYSMPDSRLDRHREGIELSAIYCKELYFIHRAEYKLSIVALTGNPGLNLTFLPLLNK